MQIYLQSPFLHPTSCPPKTQFQILVAMSQSLSDVAVFCFPLHNLYFNVSYYLLITLSPPAITTCDHGCMTNHGTYHFSGCFWFKLNDLMVVIKATPHNTYIFRQFHNTFRLVAMKLIEFSIPFQGSISPMFSMIQPRKNV